MGKSKQMPRNLHPNSGLNCVPKDMGKVLVFHSCKKAKPMSMKQNVTIILIVIMGFALGIYAMWYFQEITEQMEFLGYIILMAPSMVSIQIVKHMTLANRYDIEYYVCSDGIAEYAYEYDKKFGQVIYKSRVEHHFNEIAYLQRKRGLRTIKGDTWYSNSADEDVPEYIFELHLNNGDIIEHAATKEEDEDLLSFLERAEGVWSDIVFEKLIADRRDPNAPLAFDCSIGGNIKKGYVLVSEGGVGMNMDGYENVFAKEISISSSTITLHFEEKRKVNIPKDCLLDTAVFFKALNKFYNIDIDYYFEGDVSF